MLTPVYGIEYYIVLDGIYDYFDIIPMLELTFKRHFSIAINDPILWSKTPSKYAKSIITIISYKDTTNRYEHTDHWKRRCEVANRCESCNDDDIGTNTWMALNEDEKAQIILDRQRKYRTQLMADLPINITPDEIKLINDVQTHLGSKFVEGYWDTYYGIL